MMGVAGPRGHRDTTATTKDINLFPKKLGLGKETNMKGTNTPHEGVKPGRI